MEWLTSIRKAIDYMENHLEENITAQDVANEVFMSSFFFQKGFAIMTGCTVAEYIRNRRLYKAALDLQKTDEKIIDIAFKYCYETPESFTKAFTRFHGVSPSQARSGEAIKPFLPLKIEISIHGGNQMDYKIKTVDAFKVIGFAEIFEEKTSYNEIQKFWNRFYETNWSASQKKAIEENKIGEFAVCIDDLGQEKFRYLIAGKYTGGIVPEGMSVFEFPKQEWAVFDCFGPVPKTLQDTNTKIFKEWLPGNSDYEFFGKASLEWYDSEGEQNSSNYHSAIWIPVKKRG